MLTINRHHHAGTASGWQAPTVQLFDHEVQLTTLVAYNHERMRPLHNGAVVCGRVSRGTVVAISTWHAPQ